MRTLLRSLLQFCCGRRGRSGNVAVIFGLAIIPVVGAAGAAIDYSMASANRTSIQKALDATALGLAKLMPLSQSQLNTKGWEIFAANVGTMRVKVNEGDLVITEPVIGKLTLSATGQYEPFISGVLGINSFPVSALSQVTWGMKKLELALALDNTGSMSSANKMTELKKASKSLLTTLKASAKKQGDVKVSIIPFNTDVNVGTANVLATWLKWGDWDDANQTCSGGGKGKKKQVCVPKLHTAWTGCVMDRDQNNDVRDTTPTLLQDSTKFPAKQCEGGLTQLMPLSYDWTALNNKIDAMQPDGNTNVTIGLAWAWHSLTSSLPLTEAAAPSPELNKYIILMTDGDNTENRWGGGESSINARTALACTNVKAAGIKIYTIRVINGDANLLRNCASDPSMYFDVQNAGQLSSVFNSIGQTLASLHLSQ